jgi:hypothetical protein
MSRTARRTARPFSRRDGGEGGPPSTTWPHALTASAMGAATRTWGGRSRWSSSRRVLPRCAQVNARGVVKLVGTAQRVVRNAWLFSTLVAFDDEANRRPVLRAVCRCLELDFDPMSVGSVHSEAPAGRPDAAGGGATGLVRAPAGVGRTVRRCDRLSRARPRLTAPPLTWRCEVVPPT